jgi:hypothetical protein
MATIDLESNRPLFEKAFKETLEACCREPMPHRGIVRRNQALRRLADGINAALKHNAADPPFTASEHPILMSGVLLSHPFECGIREGNVRISRMSRMLRRTPLVKLLVKEAGMLWPTAEEIADLILA